MTTVVLASYCNPTDFTAKGVELMESRKFADCRLFPSEKNCSLYIAGSEDEVLTVAVRHAVNEHGHKDEPELREQLRSFLKDEA
jgi:predicted small metal-binding protein